MNQKAWWRSKILWANAIGLAAIMAQSQFGYAFSPELQATLLMVVNVLLRLVTNEAVGFQDESPAAPLDDYGPPKGPGA